MMVLAIDGALGTFSAAVARDGEILAAAEQAGNRALETGLSTIAAAMEKAGAKPPDLDRLAVVVGPGGFTGLRIAIAYAKSLAAAWERPLVAISSFDVLEYGLDLDPVLTLVSGRPGVISARFRDGRREARGSGRVDAVLEEIVLPGAGSLCAVGASKDVLAALAERGTVVRSFEPPVTPAAAAAALLASTREPARSVHEVRADYGELPAATLRAPAAL
jgi:tRNA threonylcarbamoyladenosine biosynthesis protein TsaB